MKTRKVVSHSIAMSAAVLCVAAIPSNADEPCGDFGECKVLIEINASDGDIGFHFLGDADDLRSMRISDPDGAKIFESRAFGALGEQRLTETFSESAEPPCWFNPEEEEEWDEVVTLREFLGRWQPGAYAFLGKGDQGEKLLGSTHLSFDLPAAPAGVGFDGSVISWGPGNDLGNCAPFSAERAAENGVDAIAELVNDFTVADPASVAVAAFEVVMVPDVEDGDPIGDEAFSIRVSGSTFAVDVPALYLASLPTDTLVKIEVGAIGFDDNATFTEVDGFCVNVDSGCVEEED